METISILDGLTLTVVSMLVVFTVLAAIWGLVEVTSKLVQSSETTAGSTEMSQPAAGKATAPQPTTDTLAPNSKHQKVAELMALVLASEDEPNKKFEIVESQRIK